MTERTFIHEIEDKYDQENKIKVYPKFFIDQCYKKNVDLLCKVYENLNPKIFKTKNSTLIMQSKCFDCGFKKSRFVREQQAKGLLSDLGIKTSLSKIPLLNFLL